MCLIAFAWRAHPRYQLVLAANRDEFFARPAAAAAYWHDAPGVLGGRDLEKGGGWLAVDRRGRWAAVTNFRDGGAAAQPAISRGLLVSEFVRSAAPPAAFVQANAAGAHRYGGFNLLVGDIDTLHYLSNHGSGVVASVNAGVHGLSNHLLDTPWPKVRRARQQLQALLAGSEADLIEGLFELLQDRQPAQEHELPSTGVGREWERALSPVFISAGEYGTRAATVLLIEKNGTIQLEERGFDSGASETHRRKFRLVASTSAATARP